MRRSITFLCVVLSIGMFAIRAPAAGIGHDVLVDLDGDHRPERVSCDRSGLAVYDSQGKLALVDPALQDLVPRKGEPPDSRAVRWETWSWGRAEAVVITETVCGSHCYVAARVIYQGPSPTPVIQVVTEQARDVSLKDADGDGITELVVLAEEISDPGAAEPGTAGGISPRSGEVGVVQSCVSEADKVAVPYLYVFDSTGGKFLLSPQRLDSERFRRAVALKNEWVSGLSVLVQKTKAAYQQEMRGKLLMSKFAMQCDNEVRWTEKILAKLLE